MGIEDRSYYRDSYEQGMGFGFSSGQGRSVVVTLIIINAVIWVIDCFTEPANGPGSLRFLANLMSADTEILRQPWNFWKLFTYGFAHASLGTKSSFFHLLFNMATLFFLGRAIEMALGKSEFTKFYLVAIVASGIGWFLFNLIKLNLIDEPRIVSVVGASGAVSAVIGLFVFRFPKQKLYLMGVLAMPAWLLGVLVVGLDAFMAFSDESRISGEAHLSGFAFAAAYHFFGWNFRWIKTGWIQDRLSGKPQLKVHNPEASLEKLKAEADAILQKIHEQGEESLTRRERKTLEKYSRKVRQRKDVD